MVTTSSWFSKMPNFCHIAVGPSCCSNFEALSMAKGVSQFLVSPFLLFVFLFRHSWLLLPASSAWAQFDGHWLPTKLFEMHCTLHNIDTLARNILKSSKLKCVLLYILPLCFRPPYFQPGLLLHPYPWWGWDAFPCPWWFTEKTMMHTYTQIGDITADLFRN